MYKSKDGLVRIALTPSKWDTILPPCDFSILSIPSDKSELHNLINSLSNTPVANHTTILFNRLKKTYRLDGFGWIASLKSKLSPFHFLDVVDVVYQKASGCSSQGFLPLSESAFMFYKGQQPDLGNTQWFIDGLSNATTTWAVAASPNEINKFTYYRKFSWEIALLLWTLSRPLVHRSFLCNFPIDLNMLIFCREKNITGHFFCDNEAEALQWLEQYNSGRRK